MSGDPFAARTGPMPATRMLSCGNGVAVAEIGSTCVVIWRASVTRERFETQRVGLESVVRSHPKGAAFLCVIESSSPVPDDDLRRASANMIAIHRPRLRYVACVMEGDGIRVAAVRLALTAMRNLVTGKIDSGFFATTAEAAAPLGKYVPIGGEESFVASVEAIRSCLEGREGGGRG